MFGFSPYEGLGPQVFGGGRAVPDYTDTEEYKKCVDDFLRRNYGDWNTDYLIPGFSAYSYLPNNPNFSKAVSSTIVSGGVKGVVVPTLIYGGRFAQEVGGAIQPWVSSGAAIEAVGVGSTALGTAAYWGVMLGGSFALPFSTTAEFLAREECECAK